MSLREWITTFPAARVATPATTATDKPKKGDVSQLSQLSQGSGLATRAPERPSLSQLSQLSQPSSDGGPVDLRDLAPTSLLLGSLVCCGRCQYFESRVGEPPDGWCRHHGCETWELAPFECAAWGRA